MIYHIVYLLIKSNSCYPCWSHLFISSLLASPIPPSMKKFRIKLQRLYIYRLQIWKKGNTFVDSPSMNSIRIEDWNMSRCTFHSLRFSTWKISHARITPLYSHVSQHKKSAHISIACILDSPDVIYRSSINLRLLQSVETKYETIQKVFSNLKWKKTAKVC